MKLINLERYNNNDKKMIIIASALLILVVSTLIIYTKNTKPKLKEESIIEEPLEKQINSDNYSEEAEQSMKCALSTCNLDCEDGLCECTYNNPDTNEEETIYCEMWS